jgi:hypothetical protein
MSSKKQTWKAMLKFANDETLTDREWEALSRYQPRIVVLGFSAMACSLSLAPLARFDPC